MSEVNHEFITDFFLLLLFFFSFSFFFFFFFLGGGGGMRGREVGTSCIWNQIQRQNMMPVVTFQ